MHVHLIDHMGSDLSVVNAARVSYANESYELDAHDKKLLVYLASHKHWTPFAHPQLSFRIGASIQIARQLFRHEIGLEVGLKADLAMNEMSRRYVKDAPTYDYPGPLGETRWRSVPSKGQSKQGSGEELSPTLQLKATEIIVAVLEHADKAYKELLELGVAPEQARLVLPMATVTEWIWTGSLYAFIRICQERLAPDAQKETRQAVTIIYDEMQALFPHSCAAWGLDMYKL